MTTTITLANLDTIAASDLRAEAADAVADGREVTYSVVSGPDVRSDWPDWLRVEVVTFPETGVSGVVANGNARWVNAYGDPVNVARVAYPAPEHY